MRLATWNVNSLGARLPRVTAWVADHQPDVLCMQETKLADDEISRRTCSPNWATSRCTMVTGVGTAWQSLAAWGWPTPWQVSTAPKTIMDVASLRPRAAGVRVHSVYVPNGRSLDNEFYAIKLAWLARLRTMLDETCKPGDAVAICGDFNVAPDDGDVWDPAHFVGMTHVSEPERAALRQVEAWGLNDVFRRFNDPGVFTLVGLPGWRFPPGTRHAHRPRSRQR